MTREGNCSCLEHAEPTTCASCIYGFCTCCTFPQEIQCRRHAPAPDADGRHGHWPMVYRGDWCGDFESRDTLDSLRAEATAAKDQANSFATSLYSEQAETKRLQGLNTIFEEGYTAAQQRLDAIAQNTERSCPSSQAGDPSA